MARKHTLDETTRMGGGFLGMVNRDDAAGLPTNVADRIFAATPGEVIGPFQSGDGFFLVRVEEVGRRPLDEDLRRDLRPQLYGQWLEARNGGNGSR